MGCALVFAIGAEARKPNVVVIYTDDQGSIDVNAYGAKDLVTPAMDSLCRDGVRFTQFYAAAAVCSPSRNSFATGRRPNSTKVWNFINHFRNAECPSKNLMRAGKPRTRSRVPRARR